jgi:hypothetical protein
VTEKATRRKLSAEYTAKGNAARMFRPYADLYEPVRGIYIDDTDAVVVHNGFSKQTLVVSPTYGPNGAIRTHPPALYRAAASGCRSPVSSTSRR